MDFKNIKLAAIDLDGTLLNDSKKLCRDAEDAIRQAHSRGIYIVPITGRPYLGVPDFIKALPEIEYLITSNGAQIIEKATENSIYFFAISNEKSKRIMEVLRSFDCLFEPFCDGVGYTEQHIFDFYMQHFTGTVLEEYFTSSRKICTGYDEIFNNSAKCADEFFVTCPDEKTRSALMGEVEKIGNIQFCKAPRLKLYASILELILKTQLPSATAKTIYPFLKPQAQALQWAIPKLRY